MSELPINGETNLYKQQNNNTSRYMEAIDMTPRDNRKTIEIHVADVVMPLIIEERDEQLYRDAESALNEKIKGFNRTNPTMNTEDILAFLSLEYFLGEKHSVLDKKMKKMTDKFRAFVESLCVDE